MFYRERKGKWRMHGELGSGKRPTVDLANARVAAGIAVAALTAVATSVVIVLDGRDSVDPVLQSPPSANPSESGSGDAMLRTPISSADGSVEDKPWIPPHGWPDGDPIECIEAHVRLGVLGDDQVAALVKDRGLARLDATQIARWSCTTASDLQSVSAVFSERLAAEPCDSVLDFVVEFQAACDRYAETWLTVGALERGRERSEAWHFGVVSMLDERTLLPQSGSEAVIQLSEAFVSAQYSMRDPGVLQLIEEIGRGQHGGTDDQIHRAALVALVADDDPYRRLAYLQGIVASPEARGRPLGNLLGHFLGRGGCLLNGDPRPSLQLLLIVLRDARFAQACAWQLREHLDEPPPQGDDGLWSAVVEQAKTVLANDE
jgi:hypothetical protein